MYTLGLHEATVRFNVETKTSSTEYPFSKFLVALVRRSSDQP